MAYRDTWATCEQCGKQLGKYVARTRANVFERPDNQADPQRGDEATDDSQGYLKHNQYRTCQIR